MKDSLLDTRRLVISAVMAAVVAVFTLSIRLPIPATGGYFNLSDVAVFFTAFVFGPIPALIAGGVGAGLADIIGGFPEFSWLSLLAHGTEGLLAGMLAMGASKARLVLAWVAGAAAMVGWYLVGEALILTGIGPAIAEIPTNLVQVAVGGVVGFVLVLAVKAAYPPIMSIAHPRTWREL